MVCNMNDTICEQIHPSTSHSETQRLANNPLERFYIRALQQYERILDLKLLTRTKKYTPTEKSDSNDNWKQSSLQRRKKIQSGTSDRLQFLAINALELTAPASDILLKGRAKWFQLSGHPHSLAPAGPATVWKRQAGQDSSEKKAYQALSACPVMKDVIPKFYREVEYGGEKFIELQDLLYGFEDPNVMDIKMGTRTFLESEVSKTTARTDLYNKMIAVDPDAPTEAEHSAKAVTKLRYMQFREQQSSTSSLGFRIEGIKLSGQDPVNDLKKIKTNNQVMVTIAKFFNGKPLVKQMILNKLRELKCKFENCDFFKTHEVVGSSIFMMYDERSLGVWLIDFAKTQKVPENVKINHRSPWNPGNHEEGFLYGLDHLINVIEEVNTEACELADS